MKVRHAAMLAAVLVGTSALGVAVSRQPQPQRQAEPAQAKKSQVYVRYFIPAPRDLHVALYKEMVEFLAASGFEFQPKLKPFPNTDYEDRGKTILSGLMPSDQVVRCLNNRSVASVLALPADFQVPEDPAQPVRVRLELASGLPPARQFMLANQIRAILALFDFKESVGYDHRGHTGKPFTRLVGTVPAAYLQAFPAEFGKAFVEQPPTLLKDLRTQPTGWLSPLFDPDLLPSPFRDQVPIVLTEVIAEPEPANDLPAPARRGQPYLDKIAGDLWAVVTSKEDDSKIVRAEIILAYTPRAGEESYRDALNQAAPSLVIEGRIGNIVTGTLRANQANGLAALTQVSVVRLARPVLVHVDPAVKFPADNAKALELSGLAEFHKLGARGQGVKVAVVDSDFRGFEQAMKAGKLPRSTVLIDLTTEYNPDIYPDPPSGDDKAIGHGTHCALAAALAAPEAEFVLVRIDSASLPQLQFVARVIQGELPLDDNLTRRMKEVHSAGTTLSNRQAELAREREPILNDFTDEKDLGFTYEILGPAVRSWLFSNRSWHLRRVQEYEQDQQTYYALERRFREFYQRLARLKGAQVVCTSLVWNDGYPLAGVSPLTRWFDEEANRKALWLVSVGNTHAQTWTGLYRDADRNGTMEFASAETPLPKGAWTHELNFLAWEPHGGPKSLELPEGARLRISLQWQEPHDPAYAWQPGQDDLYLKPLADMTLVALRQRDPSGKAVAVDDLEVVGRSLTSALRIDTHATGSTYEQVVEFTIAKAGRYAIAVQRQLPNRWELRKDPATGRPVFVEIAGLASNGIRPASAPSLPALETTWELRPRLFVQVTDQATFGKGRALWRDYQTTQGSIPILADAQTLLSVGAVGLDNGPQPYSAVGAPGTLWNVLKPNVLAYDSLALAPPDSGSAYGASVSTPFAAGYVAAVLSSGARPDALRQSLLCLKAKLLRLPSR